MREDWIIPAMRASGLNVPGNLADFVESDWPECRRAGAGGSGEMKKRAIVAGIAAFWTGAAVVQAQQPGRGQSTSQPMFQYSNVQALGEPTPRPSVVQAPPQAPMQMPADVPLPPPSKVTTPKPESLPNSRVVDPSNVPPPSEYAPQEPPTYSTHVLDFVSPWTAKGRRACGSVYMETPYLWFEMSMMFGAMKKDQTPILVTRGAANAANPGKIGDPNTVVLFDGQDVQDQPYYGGKFTGGLWFDECQFYGFELCYMFLGAHDSDFMTTANNFPGSSGIYIPFFNALTNQEDASLVGGVSTTNGHIKINSRTAFQGADAHGLISIGRGYDFRLDGLVGIRWLELEDQVTIEQFTRRDFEFYVVDQFGTKNQFIGADLGLKAHLRRNCWTLDMMSRIGIGGTHQLIRIDGSTTLTDPPQEPSTIQGGRLTTVTNLGTYDSDRFSIVPELAATLGWQPRSWVRMTMGYSWLYWTNVARAGSQIDRVVNPTGVPVRGEFVPGALPEPARPAPLTQQTDFWVQSVTLGIQFMW